VHVLLHDDRVVADVDRAVELREGLERAAITLSAMAVIVSLPPAASHFFAYFWRSFSSSVMSALSHCVTCGTVAHVDAIRSRGDARMLRIGCTSTSPHWLKSGSGLARQRGHAAARDDAPRLPFHVVHRHAAARTAALDAVMSTPSSRA
jgi:hypothetical protein